MIKKFMLLAMMAICLVSTATAASGTNQFPYPPCGPCGGDGN